MSRSETEQCVIFLRSLAASCRDEELTEYVEEWLVDGETLREAEKQFNRAAQAVELLYKLGEWMRLEM